MRLITELKRRNVFRVGLFYVVSSWLLLQIADLVFELLLVPDWTLRFIFGALLVAFPFVLFLAWAYELTPEGVKRQAEVDRDASITQETGRKLNVAVIVVVLLGIGTLALDRLLPGGDAPDQPTPKVSNGRVDVTGPRDAPGPAESGTGSSESPLAGPDTVEADTDAMPSVAVLPFTNMSPDPDQEYFSDGLSDTLIHVLTQIDGLKVPARSSSFAFKDKQVDVRDVSDQLGVEHVLEGSVQKAGNRLRIITQLIRTRDASPVWSATFDRNTDDVFAIQDEIAAEVVRALKGALLADDSARLAERHEPTLEAYQEFLKGRQAMASRTSERLYEAREHFERAVELDPDYALAMVNLGDVHVHLTNYADLSWSEAHAAALPLYERAVELDPELGEAYVSLGMLRTIQHDFDEGLALMRRGLDLAPGYAQGHAWYAGAVARTGREDESLRSAMRAAELDPLSGLARQRIVMALANAGRMAEANRVAEENLLSNPDFPLHYFAVADMAERQGDFARRLFWMREAAGLDSGNPNLQYGVCEMLFSLPDTSEARACLETVEHEFPEHEVAGAAARLEDAMAGRFEEVAARMSAETEQEHFGAMSRLATMAALYGHDYEAAAARILSDVPDIEEPQAEWSPGARFYAADLALALHRLGDTEKAERLMRELETHLSASGYRYPSLDIAKIRAIRGNEGAALDALEEAIAAGWSTPWRIELLHHPAFDAVRKDPRFEQILYTLQQRMAAVQTWLDDHPPIDGELTEEKLRRIQDSEVWAGS